MNKKKLKLIKTIISYDESIAEHKRALRVIKKAYDKTPSNLKSKFITEVKKTFKIDE